MRETRERRAVVVLAAVLGLALAGLAARLIYIYVTSSDALTERVLRQVYLVVPLRPVRGSILDTRGRLLAASVESPSIYADPKQVRDRGAAATRLGRVLSLDPQALHADLARDPQGRFVWVRRRVAPEQAEAVQRLGLEGVGVRMEGTREYPNGSLAAHVLGCVGVDEQGLEGLERLFDDRLRGRAGRAYVLADRRRRPIWSEPDQFVPAEDGHHLVLTIDATVQAIAEAAVAETQTKFRARSASAVVMDPRTGAVMALANVPTYDPARYAAYPVDSRRNRAVTDTFPPGSSCKPFIVAAALEAGVTRFGETIYCEDGYWAAARLHDAGHSYGNLTLEEGLQKSSNIMLAKLGMRLGNERLHDAVRRFGFGRGAGVWLPGEAGGLVFPVRRWSKLSTTRVAFGQEFTATPLQLATAFSAIANGGKLVQPKVVREIRDAYGRVVADLSAPEVLGRAIAEKTARDLIDRALVGVVEVGTGKAAKVPGYAVFGKTGTAQKVDPGTRAVSHTRYMASFLGGAPARDPRVVVVVVVDEPEKSLGYYGGTVAAPAVKKILEQTLPYLGIPPTEPGTANPTAHLVRYDVTD